MRATLPLALAATLLVGCGTTAPVKCEPANCEGCCTDQGACVLITSQSTRVCGAGAAAGACHVCLPGQVCAANRCVAGDGGAAPDDASITCGLRGQACCGKGSCVGALVCAARICDLPGDASVACGRVGQACCSGACLAPAACVGGVCTPPACGHVGEACCSGTCLGDATCSGAVCVAPFDAGVRLKPTGDPCLTSAECSDGLCATAGFPQGVCTRACVTSADCLAGSQCARNPTGAGPTKVCLKQCATPGTAPGGCRPDWVCERNGGTSGVPVCFPRCLSPAACIGAPTCDIRGFCCGATGAACCEGTTCEGGSACTAGYCVTVACGAVGQPCCATGAACQGQSVCAAGTCQACGAASQPCCTGSVCSGLTVCQGATCTTCGGAGQACCSGNACGAGNVCAGTTCAACGSPGQPCCAGSTCGAGNICTGTTCAACGAAGQPCCAGSACAGSNVCAGSTCQAACGATGQPCCAGGACSGWNVCAGSTCTPCGSVGQACCVDSVCSGSNLCIGSTCEAECGATGQPCCAGSVCATGSCWGGTCLAPTGGPCTDYGQCEGNTCITGGPWSGGYCSESCESSGSCPLAGGGCSLAAVDGYALCLAPCTWDGAGGGCRTGYVCDRYAISGSSAAACLPACRSGANCPTGRCENGFCCGKSYFRCCESGTACTTGSCTAGYCL